MMWGMGCCGGWGGLGMILAVVFWGVVLYGLFLLFRSFSTSRPSGMTGPAGPSRRDALEILKERYARGEITREEFLSMKKDLEEAP